jgi:4-hydroxybenzoate polyprenyltransferase
MRLHQTTGIWLLLWPCWWSIALASPYLPSLKLLVIFALGAIIMRSAGCIINDLADRKIDAQVTRTKNRPLASGEITPKQAMILLALLLLSGGALLLLLNLPTIILGISSLLLVVAYPFMKRITYWPQAFLGLTFNWGALMGWAAVSGTLGLPALLLYAAGICWTLGYDTIYAHQDKESDLLIGVKSTAVKLGSNTKSWLNRFYSSFVLLLFIAGTISSAKNGFYVIWCLIALQLYWQIKMVNLDSPDDCMRKFRANRWLGALVFLAILLAKL